MQSKLRLHFFSLETENRKTSLYGLISLNNLGFPNKRKMHCQDFLLLTQDHRLRSMTGGCRQDIRLSPNFILTICTEYVILILICTN